MDEEKVFFHYLCKSYILESINHGKHKNNINLKQYVIYNMTFTEAVLAVCHKIYLTEDSDMSAAEIQAQRTLNQTRSQVKQALGLGLAIASVGNKSIRKFMPGNAVVKYGSMTGKSIAGKWGGAIGTVFGGMAGGMIMTWGTSLVTKLIMHQIAKVSQPCYKMCRKKHAVPKTFSLGGNKSNKLAEKICDSECKIKAYQYIIKELKSELPKCDNTANPHKCYGILHTQLGRYMDKTKKEKNNIQNIKRKSSKNKFSEYNKTKRDNIV